MTTFIPWTSIKTSTYKSSIHKTSIYRIYTHIVIVMVIVSVVYTVEFSDVFGLLQETREMRQGDQEDAKL